MEFITVKENLVILFIIIFNFIIVESIWFSFMPKFEQFTQLAVAIKTFCIQKIQQIKFRRYLH